MNLLKKFLTVQSICISILLSLPVSEKLSASFASPADFEIPASELKKTEKKKRSNRPTRRSSKEKSYESAKKGAETKPADPLPEMKGGATAQAGVQSQNQSAPQHTTPVKAAETGYGEPSAAALKQPAATTPSAASSPIDISAASAGQQNHVQKNASSPADPALREKPQQVPKPAQKEKEPAPEKSDSRISHEPYSYIVQGKITKLVAVAISRSEVSKMECLFRTNEKGDYATVEMKLLPGSRFTYQAAIPPVAAGEPALYYRFMLTDRNGNRTWSVERKIPVEEATVMPGWQEEPGGGEIKASPAEAGAGKR